MRKTEILTDWEFRIDELNYRAQVKVPHTWNVCEKTQYYRGKADYASTLYIDNEMRNCKVLLCFGAVYHTAVVTVNGVFIGTHSGSGYTPFSLDITDAVRFGGENHINVTVDNKPNENMLPNMKNFDWADDGGLIRKVSVLFTEPHAIETVLISTLLTDIKDGLCSGYLDLDISFFDGHKNDNAQFIISEYKTDKIVLSCEGQIYDHCARIKFDDFKLWDFDNPNLYYLTVKIKNDSFTQRFGLRKIKVTQNYIFLNNKPVYLTGCEWMPGSHPDYGMAEPLEHSVKCLEQLKDSGCRFSRFHWQQDSSIYDWCDENGLLVQEEIPYWGAPKRPGKKQTEIAKRQADEMIKAHFNHPSIIFWGVGNELGGQFKATQKYVREMVAYFKSKDSTRCVNYVSNTLGLIKNKKDDATLYGDVAMWNEYLGLWQPCDDIPGRISEVNKICENKPLIITEFGLCEPHFSGGDERRKEILLDHIEMFNKADKIQGYVWFSLNDYRTHVGEQGEGKLKQRIHGSTDLYGNKKPSYDALCEANANQIEKHI